MAAKSQKSTLSLEDGKPRRLVYDDSYAYSSADGAAPDVWEAGGRSTYGSKPFKLSQEGDSTPCDKAFRAGEAKREIENSNSFNLLPALDPVMVEIQPRNGE